MKWMSAFGGVIVCATLATMIVEKGYTGLTLTASLFMLGLFCIKTAECYLLEQKVIARALFPEPVYNLTVTVVINIFWLEWYAVGIILTVWQLLLWFRPGFFYSLLERLHTCKEWCKLRAAYFDKKLNP